MLGPTAMLNASYSEDIEIPPIRVRTRGEIVPVYTSPSYLLDSILLSLQPIFQIRNPILMFPSMLRKKLKMQLRKMSRSQDRNKAIITVLL